MNLVKHLFGAGKFPGGFEIRVGDLVGDAVKVRHAGIARHLDVLVALIGETGLPGLLRAPLEDVVVGGRLFDKAVDIPVIDKILAVERSLVGQGFAVLDGDHVACTALNLELRPASDHPAHVKDVDAFLGIGDANGAELPDDLVRIRGLGSTLPAGALIGTTGSQFESSNPGWSQFSISSRASYTSP